MPLFFFSRLERQRAPENKAALNRIKKHALSRGGFAFMNTIVRFNSFHEPDTIRNCVNLGRTIESHSDDAMTCESSIIRSTEKLTAQ